jgi:hypothetical protein
VAAHVKHVTLVAATVATTALSADHKEVVVAMKVPASSSTGLFVTVDGTTPTVDGDECYWVPPNVGAYVRLPSGGADSVKVISSVADKIVITGVPSR